MACAALLAAPAARAALLGVDAATGSLYRISTTDASMTLAGETGLPRLSGLEFSPDGVLYAMSSGATASLYTINPDTAQATLVGGLGDFVFEGALAFAPGGTAYGINMGDVQTNHLFTLNLATGQATPIGPLSGGAHDINGLAWRRDGRLVGIDRRLNALVTINPLNADTELLAALDPAILLGAGGGMTAAGDAGFFVTSGPGAVVPGSSELYAFDLFTGQTRLIGLLTPELTGKGLGGLALPEPATVAMLAVGWLALRRR